MREPRRLRRLIRGRVREQLELYKSLCPPFEKGSSTIGSAGPNPIGIASAHPPRSIQSHPPVGTITPMSTSAHASETIEVLDPLSHLDGSVSSGASFHTPTLGGDSVPMDSESPYWSPLRLAKKQKTRGTFGSTKEESVECDGGPKTAVGTVDLGKLECGPLLSPEEYVDQFCTRSESHNQRWYYSIPSPDAATEEGYGTDVLMERLEALGSFFFTSGGDEYMGWRVYHALQAIVSAVDARPHAPTPPSTDQEQQDAAFYRSLWSHPSISFCQKYLARNNPDGGPRGFTASPW